MTLQFQQKKSAISGSISAQSSCQQRSITNPSFAEQITRAISAGYTYISIKLQNQVIQSHTNRQSRCNSAHFHRCHMQHCPIFIKCWQTTICNRHHHECLAVSSCKNTHSNFLQCRKSEVHVYDMPFHRRSCVCV